MKRWIGFIGCILILTLCVIAEADVPINTSNFPDDCFRNYVKTTYDTNGDNNLTNA